MNTPNFCVPSTFEMKLTGCIFHFDNGIHSRCLPPDANKNLSKPSESQNIY
jgi:hypothetical protein